MTGFCVVLLSWAILALPLLAQAAEVRFIWDVRGGVATGYVMERQLGARGSYAVVGYPTTPAWADTDIPAGNTLPLFYRVRAFNDAGVSDPSNVVRVAPPLPPLNARLASSGASATARRVSARTRGKK